MPWTEFAIRLGRAIVMIPIYATLLLIDHIRLLLDAHRQLG